MAKVLLIILAFGLLGGEKNVSIFNGNFRTESVRILWQVCADTFRVRRPDILPQVFFPICDCYLDHVRKNMKPEQLKRLSNEEAMRLGTDLMEQCKHEGKTPIRT